MFGKERGCQSFPRFARFTGQPLVPKWNGNCPGAQIPDSGSAWASVECANLSEKARKARRKRSLLTPIIFTASGLLVGIRPRGGLVALSKEACIFSAGTYC